MAASGPRLRPFVHAATGLFALALAVLPHSLAIACGALGVFAGWVVFPLSGFDKKLRREGEPFLGGLRTYPVAVLGLVILLPRPRPLRPGRCWPSGTRRPPWWAEPSRRRAS